MAAGTGNFMDKVRGFFGIRPEPPRNDFRNPIWGDDDDDDVDELYSKHNNMEVFDPLDIHTEISKHMHDMFKSFGSLFGDMRSFFHDDFSVDSFTSTGSQQAGSEDFDNKSIRDYYLKPGYQNTGYRSSFEDMDLDGKISSSDISGLLKKKDDHDSLIGADFNNKLMPGRPFFQTVITTQITKSDGTVETRRIIKNGNKIVEETTTTTEPDPRNPSSTSLGPISSTGIILSELSSLFKNFSNM